MGQLKTHFTVVVFLLLMVMPTKLANLKAQSTKPIDVGFLAIANLSMPNYGTEEYKNTPFLIAYQDLSLDWKPWWRHQKEHTFRIRALATQGKGPSETAIGDLQIFSNIEAGNYLGLFELYYSHQFNPHHSLLIGQSDLCGHFMSMEAALFFANSSFGALPTLTLNNSAPVFPTGAPSLVYTFSQPKWHLSIAAFDGYAGDPSTNKNNLQPSVTWNEGALFIGECVYNITESDQIIIGCHSHQSFSDTTNEDEEQGNGQTALYAMAQKTWGHLDGSQRAWQLFAQTGQSLNAQSFASQYYSIGGLCHQLVKCKSQNSIGFGMVHLIIGDDFIGVGNIDKNSESAIELFYDWQILNRLYLRPAISHIFNAGASSTKENVNVTSLYFRFEL